MNSSENTSLAVQSLSELTTALSEGERTTFNNIFRSIQIDPSIFNDHCSWSEESYTRNCLIDTEEFELILLCWEKGHHTPIHNHGGEECWVKVIEGEFKETIYKEDENGEMKMVKVAISEAGDISYMIDFMGFHCLENLSDKRSMTLHLYAKPIRSCKVYDENSKELITKDLVYSTVAQ